VGLFIALLLFKLLFSADPVTNVRVNIDPNSGVGPDNNLTFTVECSRSYLSRDDRFTGSFSIIHSNISLRRGTFEIPSDGKAAVALNFTDFYLDNGPYTIRVEVEGARGSDVIEIFRTVHGLDPELMDLGSTFRLGLGLRPTDEPDDERVILTTGHGSVSFFYVEKGNDTGDPGDRELVEYLTFELDQYDLHYRIQSDGTIGTDFIDVASHYLTEDDNGKARPAGHYAARVIFHNTFSQDPKSFDDPVTAMTDWLPV